MCFCSGLTQSTTSKCISINSINSTSNSTSTSSMPTPIPLPLHHLLHLHRPQHRHRPPPQHLRRRGRTQHLHPMPHQEPTHRREHMTLQEVTTPQLGATALHLGTTTLRQEAMPHPEATAHREHMIHRELTQQQEATPHPHRMSRQPHTGNPCPSAMITLTTRQNPLTDSPNPKHSFHTADVCVCACVCVCMCIYIRDSLKRKIREGAMLQLECALNLKHLPFSPSYPSF